jgi:2-methylaconitate cis-trans-isomerase PrpF
VASGLVALPPAPQGVIEIEHPSGKIAIDLDAEFTGGKLLMRRAALIRTARRVFEGSVCIPEQLWNGNRSATQPQVAVNA